MSETNRTADDSASQAQREIDLRVLQQVVDELPVGHREKPGLIRAVEILRYTSLDPFDEERS